MSGSEIPILVTKVVILASDQFPHPQAEQMYMQGTEVAKGGSVQTS